MPSQLDTDTRRRDVLNLPWVVADNTQLTARFHPPSPIAVGEAGVSTLSNSQIPECVDDRRLRLILDIWGRDEKSYYGVEVEPLAETQGRWVVARITDRDHLDVTAIVGRREASWRRILTSGPADSQIWRRRITTINEQEARITLPRQAAEEYAKNSSIGTIAAATSHLGVIFEKVPGEQVPKRVRTHAERGVVPSIYQGMGGYSSPEVVSYERALDDPLLWKINVAARCGIREQPVMDPPIIFVLDGTLPPYLGYAYPFGFYAGGLVSGVRLETRRKRNIFTGEWQQRNVGVRELCRVTDGLDVDNPASWTHKVLSAGAPTRLASQMLRSMMSPVGEAAPPILANIWGLRAHNNLLAHLSGFDGGYNQGKH